MRKNEGKRECRRAKRTLDYSVSKQTRKPVLTMVSRGTHQETLNKDLVIIFYYWISRIQTSTLYRIHTQRYISMYFTFIYNSMNINIFCWFE